MTGIRPGRSSNGSTTSTVALEAKGPRGQGFPAPLFVRDFTVTGVRPLSEGLHAKLALETADSSIREAIAPVSDTPRVVSGVRTRSAQLRQAGQGTRFEHGREPRFFSAGSLTEVPRDPEKRYAS